MTTKLLALLAGVAMLSGVGIAQADTMVPTTDGQAKTATVEHSQARAPQARAPMVLTDDQMHKVTAGHIGNAYNTNWHWGWFNWYAQGYWQENYGWHQG